MKFSLRDLLPLTLILALTVGCMVDNGVSGIGGTPRDDEVQYFNPGPEFKRSKEEGTARALAAEGGPSASASAPNPPQK